MFTIPRIIEGVGVFEAVNRSAQQDSATMNTISFFRYCIVDKKTNKNQPKQKLPDTNIKP